MDEREQADEGRPLLPGDSRSADSRSAGALSSGNRRRHRRRGGILVTALGCAALLAAGYLIQRSTGAAPVHPVATAAPTAASGPPGVAPAVPAPRAAEIRGRRGYAVASDDAAASVVLQAAERVWTDAAASTLRLRLRLDVWAGTETVATGTFTGSCGGRTVSRASGVTVLRPGPRVRLGADGFTIAAPSSVDVRVILDVPPGDCVVSLLGGAAHRSLARFDVRS